MKIDDMSKLQIEAYEAMKQKFGEKETRLLLNYIDNEVSKNVVNEIKHLATKEDLQREIGNLQKSIYTIGLIQFLAIVGSVIGIISFMLR